MRKSLIVMMLVIASSFDCKAQSVDEIVARYIKAIGGMEKVHAIQTVRLVQRVDAGVPDDPFVIIRKRGNKYRLEESLPGTGRRVLACDGKVTWTQFGDAPAKVDGDYLCKGAAYIDDLLAGFGAKGSNVVLLGREKVQGRDAYHLVRRDPEGRDIMHYFLDTESFLPLKSTYQSGRDHHEDLFSDYRKIDGIMFPFTTEQRWWPAGAEPKQKRVELLSTPEEGHQKQIVEQIEFNRPFDDSIFQLPSAGGSGAAIKKP